MYLAHSHVWRRLEVPFDAHKENRRNYTTRLWRIFHVKCGLAGRLTWCEDRSGRKTAPCPAVASRRIQRKPSNFLVLGSTRRAIQRAFSPFRSHQESLLDSLPPTPKVQLRPASVSTALSIIPQHEQKISLMEIFFHNTRIKSWNQTENLFTKKN